MNILKAIHKYLSDKSYSIYEVVFIYALAEIVNVTFTASY